MRLKGYGPLIGVGIAGLLILLFSETLTKWFTANRAAHRGEVIGKITHAEGSVRRVHGSDIDVLPVPLPAALELRDGDRIQTSLQSKANIVMNSDDGIEINSGSVVIFQLWNAKDANSPVYVAADLGDVRWTRTGAHGKIYFVRDGKLYYPGQKLSGKAPSLVINKNATPDLRLSKAEGTGGEVTGEATTADSDASTLSVSAEPETLSNEYIDETIAGHQAQLQNCWLGRLKDAPGLKGQIVIQFEISKRGAVKDARVAESTLNDESMKSCVLQVIERVNFRSFKGNEISLSYPITFQ